jgi:hypothetical protein
MKKCFVFFCFHISTRKEKFLKKMLSRSLFRFNPVSSSSNSSTTAAPCGVPPREAAQDTTGNNIRNGGFYRQFTGAVSRISNYASEKPYRFSIFALLFVGAIFWYEANVTHGGRVKSFSHNHEYALDTSEEGQKTRRIKAEKVLSPQERLYLQKKEEALLAAAAKNGNTTKTATDKNNDSSSTSSKTSSNADEPRAHEDQLMQQRYPASTLFVTRGHLQEKESSWNVRNHERNWSIMAQDLFKQKDSYVYRMERSKDDDFGRHATREVVKQQ